ncbi:MAG: hypothetical protein FVQ80_06630 [Planctomycetes bacterium]|nr:hypothetical protein [Planctomycetota bacterium]
MENKVFLDFLGEVLPNLEEYRAKQVNKYYREKELEWGGDSTKMEKYKNRVRVVDTFLGPLKSMLTKYGPFPVITDEDQRDIA